MTALPIVGRELGVASRKKATYRLRLGAAALIMGIWFVAWMGARGRTGPQIASEQLGVLSVLAMGFCLLSGIFLTADCLSVEKRDGTLGLLFLTDLRGYDVVLGKLTASSLQAVYALLAIFPILALSLVMGGVTGAEFWRIVVALLAALFFSLSAGMAVSAVNRETRQAMAGTLLIILTFTALLPALNQLAELQWTVGARPALLWPSPAFGLAYAFDANYRGGGSRDYWGSLATVLLLGGVFFVFACGALPRVWRESSAKKPCGRAASSWWQQLRFGAGERRRQWRERALELNPIFWLAGRDRLAQICSGGLLMVGIPFWLVFFGAGLLARKASRENAFVTALLITFGIQLILKVMVASEASRRLSEDRESGALELLLASSVTVEQIVAGQRKALRQQFLGPILVVVILYAAMLPALSRLGDRGLLRVIIIGNVVAFWTDLPALAWTGMWTGLGTKHHRAVMISLAQVHLPPWLLFILMALGGMLGGSGVEVTEAWFLLAIGNSLFWGLRARGLLRVHFRTEASGVGKRWMGVGDYPANNILPGSVANR